MYYFGTEPGLMEAYCSEMFLTSTQTSVQQIHCLVFQLCCRKSPFTHGYSFCENSHNFLDCCMQKMCDIKFQFIFYVISNKKNLNGYGY
jgi:hypothetical protein